MSGGPNQRRLLEFLYEVKRNTPPGRQGAVAIDHVASELQLSKQLVASIAVGLKSEGLVDLPDLQSMAISPQGRQAIERERQLANVAATMTWFERHPVHGWQLRGSGPQTVDEILVAMRQATDLMHSAQGPGAPVYERGKALFDLLQAQLAVAQRREQRQESGGVTIHGNVSGSTVQHGAGNIAQGAMSAVTESRSTSMGGEGWMRKLIIAVASAVVGGLLLRYVFGVG
jgi:hypothetical protein